MRIKNNNFGFDWCTYETRHPLGFYYIGKSSVNRIEQGYQGSGIRLQATWLHPNFAKHLWTTSILHVFRTEEEAFWDEAIRVPLTLLSDPFCMNDRPGGKFVGRGMSHGLLVKENQKIKP